MNPHSHPDADAFVSAILRNPAELTTRLVFADWLEETGTPSNVAWAYFIRLKVEAAKYPTRNRKRRELERTAGEHEPKIGAKLVLAVRWFLHAAEALLQIFPSHSLRVRLTKWDGSDEALDLITRHEAQRWRIFPLDIVGNRLYLASENELTRDDRSWLEFVFAKQIITVRASSQELGMAISEHYGHTT